MPCFHLKSKTENKTSLRIHVAVLVFVDFDVAGWVGWFLRTRGKILLRITKIKIVKVTIFPLVKLAGWVGPGATSWVDSLGRNRSIRRFRRPPYILIGLGCQGTAPAYYPTPPSDGLLRAIGKGRDI